MKVLKSSWKFFQTNAWTLTHFLERKDCLILFKLHYVRVCTRTVHTWIHTSHVILQHVKLVIDKDTYIVRVYSLYELWQSCTVIFRVSIMSLYLHRTKPYISSHTINEHDVIIDMSIHRMGSDTMMQRSRVNFTT